MRKKILHMTKKGEEINSIRQIYDLWVDSSESVYAEYVLTKEYGELNGRLVNSLMAFKKQNNEITEELLSVFNIPTTKTVNTLERRQYELRKQIRTLETEVKKMQKEVTAKNEKVKIEKVKIKKKKKIKRVATSSKQKKKDTNESSKIVEFKPNKKKVVRTTSSNRKKRSRKKSEMDRKPVKRGMIEIKF